MKQSAQVITFTYGFRPNLDAFLEAFAVELSYPTADEVIATANKAEMDNDWTEFWQFTQVVDPDVCAMYQYVSFCRRKRTAHHTRVAVNQNI